jgi:CrcB protein
LNSYLWISLGAVAGASSRYALSRFIAKVYSTAFPYGTLLINITGSLLLGWFMIWSTERAIPDPRWRLLICVGFCGAYTTFSSYAFESVSLLEKGQWALFGANVLLSNILCLAAAIAGGAIARSM